MEAKAITIIERNFDFPGSKGTLNIISAINLKIFFATVGATFTLLTSGDVRDLFSILFSLIIVCNERQSLSGSIVCQEERLWILWYTGSSKKQATHRSLLRHRRKCLDTLTIASLYVYLGQI